MKCLSTNSANFSEIFLHFTGTYQHPVMYLLARIILQLLFSPPIKWLNKLRFHRKWHSWLVKVVWRCFRFLF